jgi:hypothetical protein
VFHCASKGTLSLGSRVHLQIRIRPAWWIMGCSPNIGINCKDGLCPNSGNHRLSINRLTKRGKEKSPSDGHCQCQKETDDHLLACQQFLTESHIVTRLANERASFFNMNDINDISFFRTSAIIVVL